MRALKQVHEALVLVLEEIHHPGASSFIGVNITEKLKAAIKDAKELDEYVFQLEAQVRRFKEHDESKNKSPPKAKAHVAIPGTFPADFT